MRILRDYNMTKQDVSDSFNVLTNNQLKEQYDKNNVFYSEDNWTKVMGRSLPNLHKYMTTIKQLVGYFPFIVIIFMVFG